MKDVAHMCRSASLFSFLRVFSYFSIKPLPNISKLISFAYLYDTARARLTFTAIPHFFFVFVLCVIFFSFLLEKAVCHSLLLDSVYHEVIILQIRLKDEFIVSITVIILDVLVN